MTGILLAALGLLFLWSVRDTLPPFLAALLIAVVVDPPVRWLEARGWPRSRSVPLLFILLILAGIAVMVWALPILLAQLTDIITNFSTYLSQAQSHVSHFMNAPGIRRIPPAIRAPIEQQFSRAAEYVPRALSSVTGVVLTALSSALWIVIALLATYYLMLDLPRIGTALLRLIHFRHRERVRAVGTEVAAVFAAYIRGLCIVCLLYGAVVMVGLIFMRVPNAMALGVMAGVLYMVPYVGAFVTVVVTGLITLIAFNASKALVVALILLTINQVFDYIVTPRVLGEQVGLHPLASLFALVTAGTLFGIAGVILAVPVAASIIVVLRYLYPRLLGPPPRREDADLEPAGEVAPDTVASSIGG